MFSLTPTDWIAIIGVYITILGSVWGLGRYLDGRFTTIFNKIEGVKDLILGKLEYHERQDDKRFSEMRDDIWETRLRLSTAGYRPKTSKNAEEEAA